MDEAIQQILLQLQQTNELNKKLLERVERLESKAEKQDSFSSNNNSNSGFSSSRSIVGEKAPMKLKLPKFEGKENEDLEAFLYKLDYCLITYGELPDSAKNLYLISCLDGNAMGWWLSVKNSYVTANMKFEDLKQVVISKFKPLFHQSGIRLQIIKLRHTGHIDTYVNEFLRLVAHAGDIQMLDQINYFKFGCKPDTQYQLEINQPATLDKAIQIAVHCENSLFKDNQSHHTPMDLGSAQKSNRSSTNNNNSGRTNKKKEGTCNYCHIAGHYWRECRKRLREQQSGQSSSSSSSYSSASSSRSGKKASNNGVEKEIEVDNCGISATNDWSDESDEEVITHLPKDKKQTPAAEVIKELQMADSNNNSGRINKKKEGTCNYCYIAGYYWCEC